MKNLIKFIGITAITVMAGFIFAGPVLAATDDIVVIFNPNPLFGAVNFLPGQSTTAHIEIKNKSGELKPIAIEAINVNDPNHFGDVLNLEIKEGSQTILNKSLTEFFGQGETVLSNLADNASTTYDLIVTFNSGAGNNYQSKVLNNFDILIGFQGEQTPITPPGQGFGGGGSGGGLPPGLTIFNEANLDVQDISAIITWQTNYFSTSRVIYSAESEPHNFDYGNPPNYGYAHSTIEDPTKVTAHQVELTGLTPDTLYYYRVISHASPDTISRSITFKTAGEAPVKLPVETPPPETPLAETPPVQTPPPAETPPTLTPPLAPPTQPGSGNQETGSVAGAEYEDTAGQVLGEESEEGVQPLIGSTTTNSVVPQPEKDCRTSIIVLLILNLLILATLAYKGSGSEVIWQKYCWIIGLLLASGPVIFGYPACWLAIWLIITLIIFTICLMLPRRAKQSNV